MKIKIKFLAVSMLAAVVILSITACEISNGGQFGSIIKTSQSSVNISSQPPESQSSSRDVAIMPPVEQIENLKFTLIPDGTAYSVSKGAAEINGWVVIPEEYNGKKVTEIADGAFYKCGNMKGITISGNITHIGVSAFDFCSSLTSITIPNNIKTIGTAAFSGCFNLISVIFEQNSLLTSIGNSVFNYCQSLKSIEIPNNVTVIGNSAFSICYSLAGVILPDGLTIIGGQAFLGCHSLTNILIPDTVTVIDSHAFYDCSSLTSITIPAGVTVGESAFEHCSRLIIYAEVSEKPADWHIYWNYSHRPVVWDYKNAAYTVSHTLIAETIVPNPVFTYASNIMIDAYASLKQASINGKLITFSGRIKTMGIIQTEADKGFVKINAPNGGVLTVAVMSASAAAEDAAVRTVDILDGSGALVDTSSTKARYAQTTGTILTAEQGGIMTFTLPSAGIYYIGSNVNGLNFYCIILEYKLV